MRGRLARAAAVVGLGLLATTTSAPPANAEAPAAVVYLDALRQARDSLAAGDIPGARGRLEQAAQLSPGAGLAPVVTDLERTPPDSADAGVRLDAAIGALALQPGAVPSDGAASRASLRDTYARPEFRDLDRPSSDSGLGGAIRRFLNWLSGRDLGIPGGLGLIVGLIALALIAFTVFGLLRGVSAGRRLAVAEEPAAPGDDPDREWALAEAAAARGDHREAIRRAFRSALLAVAIRGRLPVDAAWTTRELLAISAGDADLVAALAPAAAAFDRAWYSPAPVSEADWRVERERCAALRSLAGRRAAVP